MKILLFTFLLFATALSQAATPFACEGLNPEAKPLFDLIENKQSTLADLQGWLATHPDPSLALDPMCETPILSALRNDHENFFDTLYAQAGSPDLNLVPPLIRIAKHSIYDYALSFGSYGLIQRLRARGGDLKKWKGYRPGMTELMEAVSANTPAVIQALIAEKQDVNAVSDGTTALMNAALNIDANVTDVLLKAGAKVNAKDRAHQTALFLAAIVSHTEVMKVLIRAGIDVSVKDVIGRTALMWLTYSATKECVDILVKAGIGINATDKTGATPLFDAAGYSSVAAITEMISLGAKVNMKDQVFEETPLMHAVNYNNDEEAVRTLIRAGADLKAQNAHGQTAYEIAKEKDRSDDLIEMLRP